ncbi:integrase catalytic domain-containing protein [Trichonephila clavipes]|nr:integrase catalytic domain-containing protein [Trichonephila clavipes]
MAFLMIEIDESERDFTRFFWDENPEIDLENKRLEIFRMTRALYVDDFQCGNVSVQAALTTCIESKQILEDARLGWDDKLPKQLEVSWNKWCNEVPYLSEINIPRYYFKNFLPSNATTIQLHCFSDASKKAYGTVAYLRIELNDGSIISSFVASKGQVAPLKTLSIPKLELMGALLSARLSGKIATALTLPLGHFIGLIRL